MNIAASLKRHLTRTSAPVFSLLAFPLLANAANAGGVPAGGHYVAGAGAIGGNAGSLVVKQSSTTGIIDWNSFSIGKGGAVTFDNGAGATLNEVTGGNLSTIAGALHASGSVYLINQSGIIVSSTGRIVTGGNFVASTQSPDGTQRGSIVDAGSIRSAHGNVRLTAANVNVPGSIAVMRGGQLWLTSSGNTTVSGKLDADNAQGSAGTIVVTGKTVDVAGAAALSASGTSKGGTILIGGDVHGGAIAADNFVKAPIATAQDTSVAKGATISADATEGVGGNVVIWSDGHTSFDGAISALGQTQGGFSEVSSHDVLAFEGTADLLSAGGKTGTLLLDPENVTISTAASVTDTCSSSSGVCAPTGDNSVLNVTTLEKALAASNVEVTTGSVGAQAGDITVASPFTWSDSTLTLNAYNSIYIDAKITVAGSGKVVLDTGTGGAGGSYYFDLGPSGFGGSINFTGGASSGSALWINNTEYTLIYSMSALQNINASGTTLAGDYALAGPLNASGVSNWTPIGASGDFTGTFEGLGNTVSNLVIDLPSANYVGLFGFAGLGAIRDVGIVGGSVQGADYVGDLVGVADDASLTDDYATGKVQGNGPVGGLAGATTGTTTFSYATGAIGGTGDVDVGGLVGENSGTISNSYATGAVSGGAAVGGLVGLNQATGNMFAQSGPPLIQLSYATGAVSASGDGNNTVGGLVGQNSGTVYESYATGAVRGDLSIGGLVGSNGAIGVVSQSYETGTVTGDSYVGGLVGSNVQPGWGVATAGSGEVVGGGTIENSYAMGAVRANGDYAGGLVGLNEVFQQAYEGPGNLAPSQEEIGTIADSYAIGVVIGGHGFSGLIGNMPATDSYWNTKTSGQSVGDGGTGQTTAQLQGSLPTGFDSSIWGTAPGLYPYLLWQYPKTPPQVVSGTAFANLTTPLASGSSGVYAVDALLNGSAIGSVVTGADGSYYVVLPSGSAGQLLLYYRDDEVNNAPVVANSYVQSLSDSALDTDLVGGYLILYSGASTASSMLSGLTTAMGNNSGADFLYSDGHLGSGYSLDIESSNTSGLTIDAALDAQALYVRAKGPVTQTAPIATHYLDLSGGSHASFTLNDASNDISSLGADTAALALSDDAALTITEGVDTNGGNLSLTTTGSGHKLLLEAAVSSNDVDLVSASSISGSSAGILTAAVLTGSSLGNASFAASNDIDHLGAFSTGGGLFNLTDAHGLAVTGALDAGVGNVSLTSTLGSLAIDSAVTGNTVDLTSQGTITESSSAALTAELLNAAAQTGITLTSDKNDITTIGTDTTSSGPNEIDQH